MLAFSGQHEFEESTSPHSIGLQNAMTVPSPGFDSNPLMIEQKRFWGGGLQGLGCGKCRNGISGLSFDGSGLFGTGLFSGDINTWGIEEAIAAAIGMYAIYAMFYQAKQTKYRLEGTRRRQRVSKAKKLRERAKKLEEQTTGIF
jgi:hypothetical protein